MSNYLYYPARASEFKICTKSLDGRHRFTVPAINCDFCGFGGVIVGDTVLYVPTEKGLEYHQRSEPNVLFFGGRGSAKSTTGRWDAHMRALAHPGYSYVILRKTYPELESSHIKFIGREMKLLGGAYNQTLKKAYYPNGSIGFFRHCAQEEDVLNLLSAEFGLMFFDEISTFDWEHVMKLAASVRVPVGADYTAMVRAATNPLGASAQKVMQYFVNKDVDPDDDPDYIPSDWYSIKANLGDNPYLDQESYRKRLIGSGLPEHVRKAWLDGEFSIENAMFNFQPKDREGRPWHVINDIDLPKIIKNSVIYRTIDAGWFPDPTVVLWIAHLGNRHIVFNERLLYEHTAADTVEVIKEDDKRLGITKVATTYCDPSMNINTTADVSTIMDKYEALGIPMEPMVNNRVLFATVMHQALAERADEDSPRIQFYVNGKDGCPYLVRTIPQMRFDPKDPAKMDDHKDDHAVVALAYYLMSHSADPRNFLAGAPSSQMRKWMQPKNNDRYVLGQDQIRGHRY